MKLYLKANNINIFRHILHLLEYKDSEIKNFLPKNIYNYHYYLDYDQNLHSSQYLKNLLGNNLSKQIKGIYFGSETCEELMPKISEIEEVYSFCQKKHINFVLVTPPIWQKEKQLEELSKYLIESEIETVVNDYALLGILKKNIILGRLLCKRVKNPLHKLYNPSLNYHNILEIGTVEYQEFLRKYGINRVALDGDYDFNNETLAEKTYYKDYYYPFSLISMSLKCNLKQKNICQKECFKIDMDYESYNKNNYLIQRYNAIYHYSKSHNIEQNFIKKRRNRLIYEPFL